MPQDRDLLDALSSSDDSDHSSNEFEVNGEYIDDDIAEMSQNILLNQSELDNLLISPGGYSLSPNMEYDSELDNYLIDPDGNNLPSDVERPWDNSWPDEDPEPAPGPHDPG